MHFYLEHSKGEALSAPGEQREPLGTWNLNPHKSGEGVLKFSGNVRTGYKPHPCPPPPPGALPSRLKMG